jgi:hypothetical protein
LRKFPATWAAEHGATDPEVEIRGRWKGHKNGRIVNRYISVEQLTTDARVAGLLCVGGPVKYTEKHGSHVTTDFLLEIVAPHIAAYYPEEHNKIAEVLARPLLWACFEPSLEHLMVPQVRARVRHGYNEIRGEHPADYNPVEKKILHIYRIENAVHIDELVRDGTDAPNVYGEELNAAQQVIAHRDHLQSMTQQIHLLNIRQGELTQQIEAHFGSLRLHLQRQLDSLNQNMRRLQAQSSFVAMNANAPTRRAMAEGVGRVVVADERAELTPRPKSLHELWQEYMFGIGDRKPAKDFSNSERGKCRHVYCRRKLVWDCISSHIRCGYTPEAACDRIHQAYGYNLSITRIINCFKRDKATGGHPNLRCIIPPGPRGSNPVRRHAAAVMRQSAVPATTPTVSVYSCCCCVVEVHR